MSDRCIRCLVSGRVQGVFFRASAQDRAQYLGLRGYARNLPDGRVEVVACGGDDALEALRRWLEEGPPHARVTGVELRETDDPGVQGFLVR